MEFANQSYYEVRPYCYVIIPLFIVVINAYTEKI